MRGGGPSWYNGSEGNITSAHALVATRGPRARHVGTVNIGTWEILIEGSMRPNQNIKKDNFKTDGVLYQEVRSICSSKEVG